MPGALARDLPDELSEAAQTKEPAADAPEANTAVEAAPAGEKLTTLDAPTLQARYLDVVGRPTGSDGSDRPT